MAGTSALGAGSALLTTTPAAVLIAAVLAAVYSAEVVAHRVGEPIDTLVLTLSVTVIEVALIAFLMLSGGASASTVARDTVFAAVMISLNGLIGLSLLLGSAPQREQEFQAQEAGSALAVLAAMVTLSLVLPTFATSVIGPVFPAAQLTFAGVFSLMLYCAFLFIRTVRHRRYSPTDADREEVHAPPPSVGLMLLRAVLLLTSLVAMVGLAKVLTPALDAGVARLEAPVAVVGVVIAMLVLMPEGLVALRAAHASRLQTSMNLAVGSAITSIGLTISAVAVMPIVFDQPLQLGLGGKEQVLLALTLLVSLITLGTGRTTRLQGALHLVILASFLFFAVVP